MKLTIKHFIRLEKLNTSSHLSQALVTTTTTDCISKILTIQSMLLKRNFRTIRNLPAQDDSQCCGADNIRYKRLRSKCENNGLDVMNQTQIEKQQIHLIANLLDLLEVGGNDSVLGMVDVIKLAQLTVSYFFWSLYEKSKQLMIVVLTACSHFHFYRSRPTQHSRKLCVLNADQTMYNTQVFPHTGFA